MMTREVTLRAAVDGANLARVPLPAPVELTHADAEAIAAWARPFAATCLTDAAEIHVGDIRPSSAATMLADLPRKLGPAIKPVVLAARVHGFGMIVTRDTALDPYRLDIVRRVVDAPQLTISARAMGIFLEALGFVSLSSDGSHEQLGAETKVAIDVFTDRLTRRSRECLDQGVAHYREHALRIAEYGRDNGATQVLWGVERRGALPVIADAPVLRAVA